MALAAAGAEVEVVGRAFEAPEAADLAARTAPDILIVNLPADTQRSVDTLRRLHRALPANRIIAIASNIQSGFIRAAIDSGAACVLSKDDDSDSLMEAIEAVLADREYRSRACTQQILLDSQVPNVPESSRLTLREWEVLDLICEELDSRSIGLRLGIKTSTVHTHRANIMKKLNIHKVAGLVKWSEQHHKRR